MLLNYLHSDVKNLDLVDYAEHLGNGAVFKRLGFLLERNAPDEQAAIEKCAQRLTKVTTRIDPKLKAERMDCLTLAALAAGKLAEGECMIDRQELTDLARELKFSR